MSVRRVLMVAACPFPANRGTPIRSFRLAEAISKAGIEVEVVTYHLGRAQPEPSFSVYRTPRVATYVRYRPGPSLQKLVVMDPLLMRKIRSRIRRNPPDVIHAHHCEGLLTALFASPDSECPVIYDAHTILGAELPHYLPRWMKAPGRWLGDTFDRYLARLSEFAIVGTQGMKDELLERNFGPEKCIRVIPNGVDFDAFTPIDPTRLGTDEGNTIVFAGNLAPYQGLQLLAEAFKVVRSYRPDARLQVVTEDRTRPVGWPAEIELINASFRELPAYLHRADIAVNPRSDSAGMPQKLLNYMAAGLPVVSFARGAEVIEHGSTGFIVSEPTPDALARGLIEMLNNRALARRLGANAQRKVQREFSWARAAEDCLSAYADFRETKARERSRGESVLGRKELR